ncbi:hypothetical protein PG994_008858 [Apiospora phragmitis]|uniref:O-methyltransferase C-terminal domain-containing protein n=1 Tax=Apiospora phragmitis TaxID=2905665 RepID=A0ABR1UHN3_9PEZI
MTKESSEHILLKLSNSLSKNAKTVSDHLIATKHPQPSFIKGAPVTTIPEDSPDAVKKALETLMEDAMGIFQLAAGPSHFLLHHMVNVSHHLRPEAGSANDRGWQYESFICLQWLSHFNIFLLVPLDGTISYPRLADLAGVPEWRLKSVLRMAMTNRLFVEPTPGVVGHSAASATLAVHPNHKFYRFWASEIIAPSAAAMVEAHAKGNDATPFNVAFDTELPLYQYIGKRPQLMRAFDGIMSQMAASPSTSPQHLVDGFDWTAIGKGLVFDVGGNLGESCVALARAFPKLEFVVQDLEHIVEEGKRNIRSPKYDDVRDRIAFEAHDFFQEQRPTIASADVYLLRQILHNWDVENSIRILSKLAKSLRRGAHIIVMDFVMPQPGSILSTRERLLRYKDLVMMQLFNSQERDVTDWIAIIAQVQPRLRITGVSQPNGSDFSLLDIVLEED